jgi:hypothetical protein
MSLPFLKTSPEEAIASIQDAILSGYQLKDSVELEYARLRTDQSRVVEAAERWKLAYSRWIKESLETLEALYESQVYAYNFRDASPMNGFALHGNPTRSDVVLNTHSRIQKLNEYEQFIREHVTIEISAGRDIYLINGDKASVKTKN